MNSVMPRILSQPWLLFCLLAAKDNPKIRYSRNSDDLNYSKLPACPVGTMRHCKLRLCTLIHAY